MDVSNSSISVYGINYLIRGLAAVLQRESIWFLTNTELNRYYPGLCNSLFGKSNHPHVLMYCSRRGKTVAIYFGLPLSPPTRNHILYDTIIVPTREPGAHLQLNFPDVFTHRDGYHFTLRFLAGIWEDQRASIRLHELEICKDPPELRKCPNFESLNFIEQLQRRTVHLCKPLF